MRVLEPIWTAKPETASRLRGRIEIILNWARVRGYREGENPARWKGHLDHLLPAKSKVRRVQHHAAMPYAELPGFMDALREQDSVGARALWFWRTRKRSSATSALIPRSTSNSATTRLIASSATGEIAAEPWRRRAFAAMSASSKNCLRACAQHSADVIGPGAAADRKARCGRYRRRPAGCRGTAQDAAPDAPAGDRVTRNAAPRAARAPQTPVVTDIHPYVPLESVALGQDRHGSIVAAARRLRHGARSVHKAVAVPSCRRRPGPRASIRSARCLRAFALAI